MNDIYKETYINLRKDLQVDGKIKNIIYNSTFNFERNFWLICNSFFWPKWVFVMTSFCHGGFFPGGFWSGRYTSEWLILNCFFWQQAFHLAGFLLDGFSPCDQEVFCPVGFLPGGFFPRSCCRVAHIRDPSFG